MKKRGIRQDTARRFHLGWNPGKDGKAHHHPDASDLEQARVFAKWISHKGSTQR